MRKLGGMLLVTVIALTGCSMATASQEMSSTAQFREAIKQSGTTLKGMLDPDIDEMGTLICKHYKAGFTTEDLIETGGERLGIAGEAALETICKSD